MSTVSIPICSITATPLSFLMASAWHVGNSASTVPEKGATSSPETGLMPIPSPMALLENTGSATSAISMAVPGTGHSAEMPVAAAGASSVEGCSATAFSLWEAVFSAACLPPKRLERKPMVLTPSPRRGIKITPPNRLPAWPRAVQEFGEAQEWFEVTFRISCLQARV